MSLTGDSIQRWLCQGVGTAERSEGFHFLFPFSIYFLQRYNYFLHKNIRMNIWIRWAVGKEKKCKDNIHEAWRTRQTYSVQFNSTTLYVCSVYIFYCAFHTTLARVSLTSLLIAIRMQTYISKHVLCPIIFPAHLELPCLPVFPVLVNSVGLIYESDPISPIRISSLCFYVLFRFICLFAVIELVLPLNSYSF